MRALFLFSFLLLLNTVFAYVPYGQDTNSIKYGDGQGVSPYAYSTDPSVQSVHSISNVFPTQSNIDLIAGANCTLVPDYPNSKLTFNCTGGGGGSYTGVPPIFINDLNQISLNTYIPTEANIDANALAVINGLDLNNSLTYLKTVGYIPTEQDIDKNALGVINGLDLNNTLSYLKTLQGFDSNFYYFFTNNFDGNFFAKFKPAFDSNITALDLNNSLQYLKTDTNFQTGWVILDSNLHATYYDKNEVQELLKGFTLDLFDSNKSSGIADYNQLLINESKNRESTITAVVAAADTRIAEFVTGSDFNLTLLKQGIYNAHIHAQKVSGLKDAFVYWKLLKRTQSGTETLLTTSENSNLLLTSESELEVHAVLAADVNLNLNDRVVFEILGTPSGSGTNPTVTIHQDGNTASRIEIATSSAALNSIFVLWNDANQIFYKQTDLNSLLQISDFNNAYVSQKDGNLFYWKTSGNQKLLSGDKNGSYDLNTTGTGIFKRLATGTQIFSNVANTIGGTVTSPNHAFGTYMGALTLEPTAGSNAYFSYYGGGTVNGTGIQDILGVDIEPINIPTEYDRSFSIYAKQLASGDAVTGDYGAYIQGSVRIGGSSDIPTEQLDVIGAGKFGDESGNYVKNFVSGTAPETDYGSGGVRKFVFGYDPNVGNGRATAYSDAAAIGVNWFNANTTTKAPNSVGIGTDLSNVFNDELQVYQTADSNIQNDYVKVLNTLDANKLVSDSNLLCTPTTCYNISDLNNINSISSDANHGGAIDANVIKVATGTTLDNWIDQNIQTLSTPSFKDLNITRNANITGRLGIGLKNPTNTLTVLGDANLTGNSGNLYAGGDIYSRVFSNPTVGLQVSGNNQAIGTLGINSGELDLYSMPIGSASGSFAKLIASAQGASSNQIQFGNTGSIKMVIDGNGTGHTTGNVGIGTTTPKNKLNVIGDANITGKIYGELNDINKSGFMDANSIKDWNSNSSIKYAMIEDPPNIPAFIPPHSKLMAYNTFDSTTGASAKYTYTANSGDYNSDDIVHVIFDYVLEGGASTSANILIVDGANQTLTSGKAQSSMEAWIYADPVTPATKFLVKVIGVYDGTVVGYNNYSVSGSNGITGAFTLSFYTGNNSSQHLFGKVMIEKLSSTT